MNRILPVIFRERKSFFLSLSFVSHKRNFNFLSTSTATFYENQYHQKILSTGRKMSVLSNFKSKLSGLISDNTRAKVGGCLAYEKVGDDIDYNEFFKHFELPDTFQSWFLALQLHVWMTISATVSDKKCKTFKISIVDSMWNDVELRMEKLATMKASTRKKYLNELVMEFQAALISYDEGILSDDTVLAAAAWRMLFACKPVHPQLLEDAVLYIRKQLNNIESQNIQNIVYKGHVTFLPLNSILSDNEMH